MVFLVVRLGGFSGMAGWRAKCAQQHGRRAGWYRELYPKAALPKLGRGAVGFWKRERNEHNFLCVHKRDRRHGRP